MNRVFIVEPQWNPSVEDQAISRAIRLGQEQRVVVIRYCVKNSIEEVILLFHLACPSLSLSRWGLPFFFQDMRTQQTHKLKISKMDFRKELLSALQQSSGNGA